MQASDAGLAVQSERSPGVGPNDLPNLVRSNDGLEGICCGPDAVLKPAYGHNFTG